MKPLCCSLLDRIPHKKLFNTVAPSRLENGLFSHTFPEWRRHCNQITFLIHTLVQMPHKYAKKCVHDFSSWPKVPLTKKNNKTQVEIVPQFTSCWCPGSCRQSLRSSAPSQWMAGSFPALRSRTHPGMTKGLSILLGDVNDSYLPC